LLYTFLPYCLEPSHVLHVLPILTPLLLSITGSARHEFPMAGDFETRIPRGAMLRALSSYGVIEATVLVVPTFLQGY
jgi:hypothetical protein